MLLVYYFGIPVGIFYQYSPYSASELSNEEILSVVRYLTSRVHNLKMHSVPPALPKGELGPGIQFPPNPCLSPDG